MLTDDEELWEPRPRRSTVSGLPDAVTIFEVAPRDGLQAEPVVVPTELKAELARRLWHAGLHTVEVTSFVPPSWVPQLADAAELSGILDVAGRGDSAVALVPNTKGLLNAVNVGYGRVSAVACSTESFAKANLNTTVAGSLGRVREIVDAAADRAISVRGYLSMSFGDPWEGHVEPGYVAELAARLYDSGCSQVALGDTIGTAAPGHVRTVVRAVLAAGVPLGALALHLHDTYGLALANVYCALCEGVRVFDSAAGGLGRCPYAPGAAGNLATEDLLWMLDGLGADTGVDLDAVTRTSLWFGERIGRESPSRVVRAYGARTTVPT